MSETVSGVRVGLDEVRRLAHAALARAGADEANAAATADNVTLAERDGCPSHGLFRIPGYCAGLRAGTTDGTADPVVEDVAPGLLRVDCRRGMTTLAIRRARPALIEKARAQGIAALAFRNSNHFAALWPDIEPIAEAGLVAMTMVNSRAYMAPPGGRSPVYGTDPFAFACPRPEGPPMVFDQASAAMARGDIQIAARDGRSVPEGTGLDREGRPTTDPAAILDGGVQLPFGGYKGASIALMIELMAGGLTGSPLAFEANARQGAGAPGPSTAGQFTIAIDPARTAGEGFLAHVEGLFRHILGDGGARLPGDRRHAARERSMREGVVVQEALHREVAALAGL